MTDPPIIGDLGVLVGKRVGAPVLVISQDVFPEIATELDRLRNPAVIGVLRGLVGAYLRRADRIVAIGETMRERLEAKGAPPERLRVIPNWVDTRAITPQPRDNEWAARHDLVDRFVVMHSGNVGHAQDLDSLVRSATFLRDRAGPPDRGGRVRRAPRPDGRARRAARGRGDRALPPVPEARAPSALALERGRPRRRAREGPRRVRRARAGCTGSSLRAAPCSSRRTTRARPRGSCARSAAGSSFRPARPDLLARTIREAADGAFDLAEMGRRGRAYVEEEADRVVAMERYRALVREMLAA